MRILLVTILLLLASCSSTDDNDCIVGKWNGNNTEDGILVFHQDGRFEMFDTSGLSAFGAEQQPNITWEAVDEVRPSQLYISIALDGRTERIPFGIYKIEDNKLILRESKTYHRSLGGIDMGVSRYEMPKDFSGIVNVFSRD